MVHTFRAIDRYFVTDTESGSVFEIDELTHLLVLRRIGQTQDIENKLKKFSAPEIAGADFELQSLIDEGVLFSETTPSAIASTPPREGNCVASPSKPDKSLYEKSSAEKPAEKFPSVEGCPRIPPDAGGVVKALCLNVCHACNLRCKYCFADNYGIKQQITPSPFVPLMSKEIACAAVDFLIEKSGNRKNVEIDFFGGEPLLNFEVVKAAVAYARGKEKACGKKFRFTITTNGINLDKDKTAFINKEFSNVVISIDGRESVHNLIRKSADGRDTWRETVDNALAMIKERKGAYFIRGTFTNKNLDFAKDFWAIADLGFKYISMEPVALPDSHPLAIKEEHLEYIYREYETLAESLLEKGDDAPDFFHFRLDLEGAPCREKLVKGCGAGGEYAAISPDGGIYPCHQFDGKKEYRMGNLSCLNKNLSLKGFPSVEGCLTSQLVECQGRGGSTLPQHPIITRKACAECWAKYYCGGGCAANSVSFMGGADKPYETACKLFKKRAELAIALYANRLTDG